jgi:formiminotetrahydrofolate cyclodeaminase
MNGGSISIITTLHSISLLKNICLETEENKYVIKIGKDLKEIEKKLNNILKNYNKDTKLKKTKEIIKRLIETLLVVRKTSQEVEKIGFRLSKIGNKSYLHDAKTAIHLSHASSKSALESIKVFKSQLLKLK